MQWADVLSDPCLRDLPYKIELNEYGQIVMSPASNKHAFIQAALVHFLNEHFQQGYVLTECVIDTYKGIKVADVVWCSLEFFQKHGYETPYSNAPELCIEIMSLSNTRKEMDEKRQLYFAGNAREVWIIAESGELAIYNVSGQIEQSSLGSFDFPNFGI